MKIRIAFYCPNKSNFKVYSIKSHRQFNIFAYRFRACWRIWLLFLNQNQSRTFNGRKKIYKFLIQFPFIADVLVNLSENKPFDEPCHTGLIYSRSFQNYAFKGWLSLETMKLWLLVLPKTLFLMTLIIKLTLGNIFIKVKNPPGGATVTK